MSKRYEIWDKQSVMITPIGEVFTPEQWIERYPAAAHIAYVCATGEIKGAFFESLGQMVSVYESAGVDFSECTTDQEKLDAIEAYEDAMKEAAANATSTEERTATALEAIAEGATSETKENVAALQEEVSVLNSDKVSWDMMATAYEEGVNNA